MKKCKKVLALVLALLMLVSAVSVGFSSFAANGKSLYTGESIKNSMNAVDEFELNSGQYATMILDFADKTLAELNIKPITIPTINVGIQMGSIDELIGTIQAIARLKETNASFLGNAANLNFTYFTADPESITRRPITTTKDEAIISAFVGFLSDSANANIIKGVIKDGTNSLNLNSIINGFIPDEFKNLDVVGMIKEGVFGSKDASFDDGIADLITSILNGLDLEMLDGYSFTKTDSIYLTIDKVVRALTKWAVKQLQDDAWNIEENVLSALPTFKEDYPFVDLSGLKRVEWTWEGDGCATFTPGTPSTYLVYHINNLIGHIVERVFPEFAKQYTWTTDKSTNSLSTLDDNIAKAAEYADKKLNGGTFTAEDLAGLDSTAKRKAYAMVLADAMLKMFFPGIKVDKEDIKNGCICKLAVQALNEFFAYYIPEEFIDDLYIYKITDTGTEISFNSSAYPESTCKTLYKQMAAKALSKFLSGYFPVFTDGNWSGDIDQVAKVMLSYFLNTVCKAGDPTTGAGTGALGTVSSTESAYTAIDRIIFSYTNGSYVEGASSSGGRNKSGILPKGILPSAYNTTLKLKNLIFDSVENLSVGSLLGLLVPNSGSTTEMNEPLFPKLATWEIIRIINVIFPGTWTSKTDSLDTLITKDNLANMLYNILTGLKEDYHVKPGIRLACFALGLSTPQKRGVADVSLTKLNRSAYEAIGNVIPATSTTIPDGYYIKIDNTTKGINTGFRNGGNLSDAPVPDDLYKIYVKSVVCENDSKVQIQDKTSYIDDNSSDTWSIGGSLSKTNEVLSILVTYQISLETNNRFGPEQQTRLYVFAGMPASTTLESGTVNVKVPNAIYGSPSMINNAVGLISTDNASSTVTAAAKDYSTYPSALTSAGITISATDPGSPSSTSDKPFNPVSISVPGTVNMENYYGSYSMTYTMKSKDPSVEGSDYANAASANINLVLFDDAGLPSLFNSYNSMDLQKKDFMDEETNDETLWNAFQTQMINSSLLINSPTSSGKTAPADLKAAFAAQAEALKSAYNKLAKTSNVDYSAELTQRIETYSDGNEADGVRAKFTMWDYTPVSYARFSSSMSTVKEYKQKGETSSVKLEEALRYNEAMSKRLFTSTKTNASKAAALQNLKDLLAQFDKSKYNEEVYTPASYEAIIKAIDDATAAAGPNNMALDGTAGAARTSDYADARAAILKANNLLTETPLDVAALNTLVKQIKSGSKFYNNEFDNMYYTDESWAVLEKALNDADVAINDPFAFIAAAGDKPTEAEIATAQDKLGDYVTTLEEALAGLVKYKSVLELKNPDEPGFVTFKEGQKLIIGSVVIDADNYVILPYGQASDANNLALKFRMSSNTSHYTKDANGKWNTYSTGDTLTTYNFKLQKQPVASGTGTAAPIGNLTTGHAIKITDANGNNKYYTIAITGAPTGQVNEGNWNDGTSITAVKKLLPNIIANIGMSTYATKNQQRLLACDLNGDGKVDITDMVLLKKWENTNDNYEPYHAPFS